MVNIFSLLLGFGASLGLIRVLMSSPVPERLRWLVSGLITLAGSLIGARAAFVAAYWPYYSTHTAEIIHIEQGGLFWPGAVAGAFLFAVLCIPIIKKPYLYILDVLSPMFLLVASIAWLGSWKVGAGYGQALQAGTWWGVQTLDEYGIRSLRAPLQFLAAAGLIVLLFVLEARSQKKLKTGLKASITSLSFSAIMLAASFFRADPMQTILNLRLETWASMLFTLGSIVLIILVVRRPDVQIPAEPENHNGAVQ